MDEAKVLDKRSKVAKYLNSHLKGIAEKLNLSVPLQTKTARDAYATFLKNKGVRIEIISENMGHTSINTTRHYLDSFDTKELHKANNLLP
jgi:site-specific recombinase XerD